jgi:hypothetical protein
MKKKQTKIERSGANWVPGAMAFAATAAGSNAATVQITLQNNKISTTGGNQLNADLTGDANADIVIQFGGVLGPTPIGSGVDAGWGIHGSSVRATWTAYHGRYRAKAGHTPNGVGTYEVSDSLVATSAKYLNPVVFSDARINDGAATEAWLEVYAFNVSKDDHTVELARLLFDKSSTMRPAFDSIPGVLTEWSPVPEPSGFLATSLLLGAAGLIRRRQARAA